MAKRRRADSVLLDPSEPTSSSSFSHGVSPAKGVGDADGSIVGSDAAAVGDARSVGDPGDEGSTGSPGVSRLAGATDGGGASGGVDPAVPEGWPEQLERMASRTSAHARVRFTRG
jgi:hypothetical protein